MPSHLREEEVLILDTVKRITRERVSPRAAQIDHEGRFPEDIRSVFSELGLLGLNIPEEFGGFGASTYLFVRTIEEVSKVCLNSSNVISQQDLGAQPLLTSGNEEQKRRYLPRLASGEFLASFALTEPGAGSDAGGITTTAHHHGDGYIINGAKRFITWANQASLVTVFVRTSPGTGNRGLSALLVEKGTSGMSVGKIEEKMGLRGSPTAELNFDNCYVPKQNLLGDEGDGFKVAMRSLNHGRLALAAAGLGLAQGALDFAVSYLNNRVQFGQPLSQFQGLQFKLAERATQIEAARQLTYHACREHDSHSRDSVKLCAMAKLMATDTAMEVAVDAVQFLGGYGYTKEYPVERMMRDAKILQIVEGTSEIQKIVIASQLVSRQPG